MSKLKTKAEINQDLLDAANEGRLETTGNKPGVKDLIEIHGADINHKGGLANQTALMFAKDKNAVFKYLVEKGAKLDMQDSDGNTILYKVTSDDTKLRLLLSRGANPTISNKDGKKPSDNCIFNHGVYSSNGSLLLAAEKNWNRKKGAAMSGEVFGTAAVGVVASYFIFDKLISDGVINEDNMKLAIALTVIIGAVLAAAEVLVTSKVYSPKFVEPVHQHIQ